MIRIDVEQKGARVETLGKLVKTALAEKYPDARVSVSKIIPATSRAARFDEAVSNVTDGKSEAEGLRDELQDWFDNLPENFQSGDKGSEIEEAISSLDEFIEACDTAENASVDFPGMY